MLNPILPMRMHRNQFCSHDTNIEEMAILTVMIHSIIPWKLAEFTGWSIKNKPALLRK